MKHVASQPSRSIAFFFALALSIIWAPSSYARTTVIDDSGTTTLEPTVRLRWKSVAPPRSGTNNQMVGLTTVRVHLNVLPWLKRSGRIYLALPAQPPGPLTATWTAEGRLAAGQAHSGTRTLRTDHGAVPRGRAQVPVRGRWQPRAPAVPGHVPF